MRIAGRIGYVLGFGALGLALASGAPGATEASCSAPEYRQLDFWLGEWDVQPSPGQPGAGRTDATSQEEKILGGCALVENYEEPGGMSGKSLNFYDGHLKKWRQLWTDSAGNSSEFSGEFKNGAMRLEGESHTADGSRVFRKMNLTPEGTGRVRQSSEASRDGKTWKFLYDLTYVRKNPH